MGHQVSSSSGFMVLGSVLCKWVIGTVYSSIIRVILSIINVINIIINIGKAFTVLWGVQVCIMFR